MHFLFKTRYKGITGTISNVHCTLLQCYITEKNWLKNHCFISDDINYDVNIVLTDTIAYINVMISEQVRKVSYFSDGCVRQYKNCKHFLTFACINQISPLLVNGTSLQPVMVNRHVKRLTARASLQ